MSANETRHTSETGGQKAGNDERYDLIPVEPLRRLAIYAGTRSLRATGNMAEMCNHIWLFWSGEEVDATTEWVHLIAASWHAMRLAEQNNFTSAHPYDTSEHGRSRARYDLIPTEPLRLLAKHFGVGSRKYDDDNWRRGYDWRLSFSALNRHLWQWWAGEEIDQETGSPHLIAVAWHCLVLDEFTRIQPGFDTRIIAPSHLTWCSGEERRTTQ